MSKLYDRNFVLTIFSQMFLVSGTSMINHYARWISFLGGNEEDVGWIMGIGPICGLLMRPWIGPWIDRIGSRASQAIGCGCIVLGILGNLVFHDLSIALYFLRAGLVIGGAIYFGASATYVTLIAPKDRKTEALGMMGCGGFIGMAVGPLLGDWLLGKEETRTFADFQWMFVLSGLSALIAMILICTFRPAPSFEHRPRGKLSEFLAAFRTYWPGSILLVDATFGVCMTVVLYFLSKYLDQVKAGSLGGFFSVYCAWAITLRMLTRRLPDRVGNRKVTSTGMLFFTAAMFAFLFFDKDHAWVLYLAAFLAGTGHALTYHTMYAVTTENFPIHLQGTGAAVMLTFMDTGTIISSPIFGYITYHSGYRFMFWAAGLLCLFTFVVFTVTSLAAHKVALRSARQPIAKP